jgi:itaconate CoA-transferase
MAYQAILAAIIQRGRTGEGDHIEISMLEAMAEWMGFPMYYALDGASPPPRAGAGHATIFPYGPYRTADGTVLFGLQNDREWAAFARIVLGRPELAEDARFKGNAGRAAHREAIEAVIDGCLSDLSTAEAAQRLERAGIANARVNDMAAFWTHPQLAARGRWAEVDTPAGPMPALKPLTAESWEARLDPVPALGEHNARIFAELGLADPAQGMGSDSAAS